MTDAASLARAVRSRHVLVIGGGIAGLVAAHECAKIGLRVTLVERAPVVGGTIRTVEIGGHTLDAAVEGFSRDTVAALAAELGLPVVHAGPAQTWIAGTPGGVVPFPDGGVLGIPQNPWDERVRRIIGWRGSWRAYVDRLRPPLTIGQEGSLGRLVRTRMGDAVRDRLVAPLSVSTLGIHPDDVDVEVAAPGLSAALTRTGSLAGGVAQLRGEHPDAPAPLATVEGGVARLVEALRERLDELGADVRTDTAVERIARRQDGRWDAVAVTRGHAPAAPDADAAGSSAPAASVAADLAPADAVIVATDEAQARLLLAPLVPPLDTVVETPPEVEVVTLVVDAPALDAHPRGDAVIVVPGSRRATGVVQSTARWPWLARSLPAGRHVLRVTFGTLADPPATEDADDPAAVVLAHAEAEALYGTPLALVGGVRERFAPARPVSALGHRDAAHAVRSAVHAVAGLGVTGAWLAGSGLAQVVPDALAEADRVRSALVWERPAASP